jgi:hypothetical protein
METGAGANPPLPLDINTRINMNKPKKNKKINRRKMRNRKHMI